MEMEYAELRKLANELYNKELEEMDAKYTSDWDRNVGECPYWFWDICKHEFYGEKPCEDCIKFKNE